MSLNAMQLQRAVSELNQLEALVGTASKHARVLRGSAPSLDARKLLRLSSQLKQEAAQLTVRIQQLIAEGTSAARQVSRAAAKQSGVGRFEPSSEDMSQRSGRSRGACRKR